MRIQYAFTAYKHTYHWIHVCVRIELYMFQERDLSDFQCRYATIRKMIFESDSRFCCPHAPNIKP